MKTRVIITGERVGLNRKIYKATLTWIENNKERSVIAWSNDSWNCARQKAIKDFKAQPVYEILEIER